MTQLLKSQEKQLNKLMKMFELQMLRYKPPAVPIEIVRKKTFLKLSGWRF